VKLDLAGDWAKIWPIVHPFMIKPGQEDSLAKLTMAGTFQRTINVSGSYPASDASGRALPWYESLKSLVASGDIPIQSLDTGDGIAIEDFEAPFSLKDGQVALIYAGKSGKDRLPKPFKINGGTGDISGITVNLAQATPRLSIGKNQKLAQGVTINPLLGETLGKFVNPVFANSTRAKGLLDVTVEYCQDVALASDALKGPESGRAKIIFSLSDMDIANPLGDQMLSSLPLGQLGLSSVGSDTSAFRGQIKDAVVTLDRGRAETDITFALMDPNAKPDAKQGKVQLYPLRFAGDVRLASLAQNLTVTIPPQLLRAWTRSDDIQKWLPDGLPLTLKGTTVKPVVDAGDIPKRIVEAQLRARAGDLLGGGKDKKMDGDNKNPLGGLLDQLGGDKDKDKDKKSSTTKPADTPSKKKKK
jgi:hypothetical protein